MTSKESRRFTLYCSFCGASIGPVEACGSCGRKNEFVDVTPPGWVVEGLEDDTEQAPGVAPRPSLDAMIPPAAAEPPSVVPRPPDAPPSPAAADETPDDKTVPLPANDDRTVPLPGFAENPVVAVLICQDECEENQLRHELRQGELTVGRRDAQILVPSEHVSKRHALLRIEPAEGGHRILLVDQGAGNGTFVNGERLLREQPRELQDKDSVAFANVRFLLRTSDYSDS